MNSTTDRLSAVRLADDQAGLLTVSAHGTDVLTYAYRPELPAAECPGPALHPLRTLSGGTVTMRRPNEHRHHKGLVMMAMHLSGQNFVGGSTYVPGAPGHGYVDLPNVGRLDHTGFADVAEAGRPGFTETLAWRTADGEHWIDELRTVTVTEVDPDGGHWTLEFATELHNVRGETLTFGSPTVYGRENAGYCGLLWRGPRDFGGGRILAADGLEGPEASGHASPWLAFGGEFDVRDGHATLLFRADPECHGESGPHWFVRNLPFAVVNPSLAFYEERHLPAGDTLRLRYRVTIADGAWHRERIEKYLADRPW
ncbi:PmoA family protein [Streptomyces sp. UG1]|uniref:DUF6807 domain-containing protein n=1 Tax=Streptomyces sp. UG1 TaxID=3417652 RepID=UPI003CF57E3D